MPYWVRLGAPGAPFGCAGFAIWVRQVRLLRFWVRRRTFWVRPSKKAHLGFAFSKGAPWARQIHVNGFSDSSNAASWILRYPVLNMHGRITLRDGTRSKRVVIVAPNECIQCTRLRRIRILELSFLTALRLTANFDTHRS